MTTGVVEPLFVDSDVLVFSTVAEALRHAIARRTLEAHANARTPPWVSRQVLREFLAVLTRPQQFSPPLPIQTLAPVVVASQVRFQVADETAAVTDRLLALLEQVLTGGRQVHDANVVATMLAYGIRRLLTANAGDFSRFAHLITVDALEVSA